MRAGSSVTGTGGYTAVEQLALDVPDGCIDATREIAWFNAAEHVWTRDVTGP